MTKQRCAIVGVGQTQYMATRGDVSLPGLLREAALRAHYDSPPDLGNISLSPPDFADAAEGKDIFSGAAISSREANRAVTPNRRRYSAIRWSVPP